MCDFLCNILNQILNAQVFWVYDLAAFMSAVLLLRFIVMSRAATSLLRVHNVEISNIMFSV